MMAGLSSRTIKPGRAGHARWWELWVYLLLLLTVEIVSLTILFDSEFVTDAFLDALIRTSRVFLHLAVIVAVVLFAFGPRFRDRWGHEAGHAGNPSRPRTCLVTHPAAFATFVWLTSLLVERGDRPWPASLLLGVVWAGSGLLTLASWLALGLPPRRWIPLARSEPGMMTIGIVVGLAGATATPLVNELWNPLGPSTLNAV